MALEPEPPSVCLFCQRPIDTSPSPTAGCSTTRLVKAWMPSCLSSPRCRRSFPSVASIPSRRTSTSHPAASMQRTRSCSRLTCRGTTPSGRSSAPPAHKVFAFVSAPTDTPQLSPLLPCAQYLIQRPRPRGRSRSRRGPRGQHHTAIPQVGRLALKPAPSVRLSAPADTHRMPLPLAVSTGTRFRSTSSRAQSQPRRSTFRARG